MTKFRVTIVFEDGEVTERTYKDCEKARKVAADYDELLNNGTHGIKAVHIREI